MLNKYIYKYKNVVIGRNALKKFLEDNNIDTLFHFTRAKNLPNIIKYGLLPINNLYKESIDVEVNDEIRLDNCLDAICMSIEFPNYKMFYKLRNKEDNIGVEWALLKLNIEIILKYNCVFCNMNASKAEMSKLLLHRRTEFEGIDALKLLYKDIPGLYSRKELNIPKYYTTNPQAEVLVFGEIPINFINEIHFESKKVYNRYIGKIPSNIYAEVKSYFFNGRRDHKFW
jgi:hypothetical protein